MRPPHLYLRGPMRSLGSATDTQGTEGKKYEDANDGHDCSPPSGGNCRYISDRPRFGGANKSADLSQKNGLRASLPNTRIRATNREPLLRAKREGHQQVPVAQEEVPGREHQTFIAAPMMYGRTCAELCFLGPED